MAIIPRRAIRATLLCLGAAVLPSAVAGCGEVPPPASEAQAVEVSAALSDEAYLVRLGLMRGHLLVGHALYAQGALDAARSHSKHPTDELYAGMGTEFAARGTQGFSAELEAYAKASQGAAIDAVDTANAALLEAIARAEAAVAAPPGMIARVTAGLLREAASEYSVGIVEGRLANAHEYQDAYGFTQVALMWAARVRGPGDAPFGRIGERIAELADMWPSLVPPAELDQQAARLYGTAADVEILALDLRAP